MQRLENALTAIAVALAAILTTLAHVVEDDLGLPVGVKLAADAVIVALALTLLKQLIAATLLEWPWVRRALLQSEYIEGTWIDVVCYPDQDPLIGVVHLSPQRAAISYSGENITLAGTHLGQFSSEAVRADFPKVTFHYTAGGPGTNGPFLGGIGTLVFDHRQGPPFRYTGYCLDAAENARHMLLGSRVTSSGDLDQLEDTATRMETALRLAEPLLAQCPPRAPNS